MKIFYTTNDSIKEEGKLRTEGRGYYPKDGDIMFFKFNVSNKK